VVCIKTILESLWQKIVNRNASIIQAPDIDRIEPEICFRVGAIGVCIVAIPTTIAAQVDSVEIFHAQGLFCCSEGAGEERGVGGIAAEVVEEGVAYC
jgi:hypothetical protein